VQNDLPAGCGAPSDTVCDVIAVAASLGGPAALARLVAAIPSSCPRVSIATGAVDFPLLLEKIAAASFALVMVPRPRNLAFFPEIASRP
jgi:hypothetical protein